MKIAKPRHLVGLSVLVFSALLALSGCASSAPSPTPTTASGQKVYSGTPAEWTLLVRACIEDNGLKTADLPDGGPGGFMVSNEGVSAERRTEITEKCRNEIGVPQIAQLSEDELHRRYSSRLKQFECLVESGLASGSPMSFETFVDEYNRSGQKRLWEPGEITASVERDGIRYGAADICPPDSSTW